MSDILDELETGASTRIGLNVHNLGGDLFDEMAVKDRDPEALSEEMKTQAVTEARRKSVQTLADDMSVFEKFRVGVGRGGMTLMRGAGLAEPEDPAVTRTYNEMMDANARPVTVAKGGGQYQHMGGTGELTRASPTGMGMGASQILGEAAPFLPLGLAAGAAKTLMGRIVSNALLGGAEGGLIMKGSGGNGAFGTGLGATIAGAVEAINPLLGRLGSALFTRVGRKPTGALLTPEGIPTAEFQAVLNETGTKFDDLVRDAFTQVTDAPANPATAARTARFKAEGVPATQGDVGQVFDQQASESRLVNATGEQGDAMRAVRLDQSQIYDQRITEMIDSLGMPADAGESLKSALSSRAKLLRKEKNEYYKLVEDAAPDLVNAPLFTDDILMAVPDARKMQRWRRAQSGPMQTFDDLMIEFGIDDTPELVESFIDRGGDIIPLNLGNFDDFRQELGRITRADQTGTVSNATGPVMKALDGEVAILDKLVVDEGLVDAGVLANLKEARARVVALKTEFDPAEITGRLIAKKKNRFTPVVEASQAAKQILRPGAPIEHLDRTMKSLLKQGDEGRKAIGNMQAAVVFEALEKAQKASSNKIGGVQMTSGGAFARALDAFGDDKLKMLFRGNEKGLAQLMNLKQIGMDMTATAGAVPKGSASVNLDITTRLMEMAGTWTGLTSVLMPLFRTAAKSGGDERTLKSAMNLTPQAEQVMIEFSREFPTLASTLGIAGIATQGNRDE